MQRRPLQVREEIQVVIMTQKLGTQLTIKKQKSHCKNKFLCKQLQPNMIFLGVVSLGCVYLHNF